MTVQDYRQFSRYCLLHDPWLLTSIFLYAVGAITSIEILFELVIGDPPVPAGWPWLGTVLAAAIGIIWLVDAGSARTAKKTPGALGPVWVRISPMGFEERTSTDDARLMWVRFQRIVSTPHAIYHFVERHRAYVVPRQAFETPADADAFFELACSYWQAARDGTGTAPTNPPPRESDHAV
jgi:hypothetical protein